MMQRMKMKTAARGWLEGFPIGSGRIAAMVCSEENRDILTLNHEWLWTGTKKVPREAFRSAEYLPMVRSLLNREEYHRATGVADILFGGFGSGSGIPANMDGYQYAGNLQFVYDGECALENRELILETGVASASRAENGLRFTAFCDCVADCLLMQWKASAPFSGQLTYFKDLGQPETQSYEVREKELIYFGGFPGGVSFSVKLRLDTDGELTMQSRGWSVQKATYLTVSANVACSASSHGEGELDRFLADPAKYDAYREAHEKTFAQHMHRVEFALEDKAQHPAYLEERMQQIRQGAQDDSIYPLLYDFARYLMLSCCLTAELPINLQGKWNCYDKAPWNSDYHYDINLQMCYWMAESAGLGNCTKSLFDFLMRCMPAARTSAKNVYGCRGIWFPLGDDAWGQCTPESTNYGVWVGAAPWLAQHLWWHYLYTGDQTFLKETAYPFFREVAMFYEDYLCDDGSGRLQIMPSQSPENRFVEHKDAVYGECNGSVEYRVSLCKSSAMDIELANDALSYAIRGAELLGVDEESVTIWKELKENLAEVKIASDGRIVEWTSEACRETDIGHKHLSHLYGLYPSEQFTADKEEALHRAAVTSLYTRLDHSGIKPGWGEIWAACMLARTQDGKRFSQHIRKIPQICFMDNLLDQHPNFGDPIDSPVLFQIDGNFGVAAVITEAVAAYWGDRVHLLYNLPEGWETGHLYGVKVPGGHTLYLDWEGGRVTKLEILCGFGRELQLSFNGQDRTVQTEPGKRLTLL